MRNNFTGGDRGQEGGESAGEPIQVQLPLGMLATLEDVERGFFSLCVAAGREVLTAMMHDRTSKRTIPFWTSSETIRTEMEGGGLSQHEFTFLPRQFFLVFTAAS
jgi:hypothetical protein